MEKEIKFEGVAVNEILFEGDRTFLFIGTDKNGRLHKFVLAARNKKLWDKVKPGAKFDCTCYLGLYDSTTKNGKRITENSLSISSIE